MFSGEVVPLFIYLKVYFGAALLWSTLKFDGNFKERELEFFLISYIVFQNNLQTAHLEEKRHSFQQIDPLEGMTTAEKGHNSKPDFAMHLTSGHTSVYTFSFVSGVG